MSIPLKGRLSYIWASATGQDRVYSHVFEEKGPVYADDITSHWAEARPVKGQRDKYEVWLHSCAEMELGVAEYKHIPISARAGEGPLSRAKAVEALSGIERVWMMNRSFRVASEQPFMKFVETKLTYPPPPDIAPKAVPLVQQKENKDGKLAVVIDIRTRKRIQR